MKQTELKTDLQNDIDEMELKIVRLQNRIVMTRGILKELEIADRRGPVDHPVAPPAGPPSHDDGPTVVSMVLEILPGLREPFWYSDIKDACINKHPQYEAKIRRGVHPACHSLAEKHTIIPVQGGFKRKEK